MERDREGEKEMNGDRNKNSGRAERQAGREGEAIATNPRMTTPHTTDSSKQQPGLQPLIVYHECSRPSSTATRTSQQSCRTPTTPKSLQPLGPHSCQTPPADGPREQGPHRSARLLEPPGPRMQCDSLVTKPHPSRQPDPPEDYTRAGPSLVPEAPFPEPSTLYPVPSPYTHIAPCTDGDQTRQGEKPEGGLRGESGQRGRTRAVESRWLQEGPPKWMSASGSEPDAPTQLPGTWPGTRQPALPAPLPGQRCQRRQSLRGREERTLGVWRSLFSPPSTTRRWGGLHRATETRADRDKERHVGKETHGEDPKDRETLRDPEREP